MHRIGALSILWVLLWTPCPSWAASLVGDMVGLEFVNYGTDGEGPFGPFVSSATVGPGTEFDTQIQIDIGDSSIALSAPNVLYFGPEEFDRYTLTGLDFDSPAVITGVSFAMNTVGGFDLGDISFTANSISMVFDGTVWNSVNQAVLIIETTPVPEPSSAILLGCGVLALLFRSTGSERHAPSDRQNFAGTAR